MSARESWRQAGFRLKYHGAVIFLRKPRRAGGSSELYVRWWEPAKGGQPGRDRKTSVATYLRKDESAVTLADAKLVADAILDAKRGGQAMPTRADRDVTVGQIIERWRLDYKGRKDGGVPGTEKNLGSVRKYYGDERAATLTKRRLLEVVEVMRTDGLAAATIAGYQGYLKSMLKWAADPEQGLMLAVPVFPRLLAGPARQGTIRLESWQRIRPALPAHYQPVGDFGYLTGWRLDEVLGLEWDRVDFDAGEALLGAEHTKTRKPRRRPIEAYVLDWLRKRRQSAVVGVSWVFPGRDGRRITQQAFEYVWRRARTEAGLPAAIFHDFRRTAYARYLNMGFTLREAMAFIGHTSPNTAMRYTVVEAAELARASEKIAASKLGQHEAATFEKLWAAGGERPRLRVIR